MLERATERFFPRFWARVDQHITSDGRRRLFIGIAIIFFVYANFKAWEQEHQKTVNVAPRDPTAFYSDNASVAQTKGVTNDTENNNITFAWITTNNPFDFSKTYEY